MRAAATGILLVLLAPCAATAQQPPPDTGRSPAPGASDSVHAAPGPGKRGKAAGATDTMRVVRLAPVQVTVTRHLEPLQHVAQAVTTLSTSQIRSARATVGLDESLSLVPGVMAENRYSVSLGTRLSIRGFGSRASFGVRGIRILVDGIPLTNADGQAKLTNLDLGSSEKIEVIRGPASSLYGNAAGGVVSVRTEPPPAVPFAGEARIVAGDEGAGAGPASLRKLQLKVGGRAGRASYYSSFARTRSDGFRDYSAAELRVLSTAATFVPNDASTVRLLVNVADQPLAESPGSLGLDSARLRPRAAWPANVAAGAAEQARQAQGGIAYGRRLGASRFDVLVYGANRIVNNPLTYAIIDLNRHSGGLRTTLTSDATLGGRALSLTTGLDLESQRDARKEFTNLGTARRGTRRRDQIDLVSGVGPFAEAQLSLAPRLRLGAGVRYDAVRFTTEDRLLADGNDSGRRKLRAISPKASLLIRIGQEATAYATVATSFQTPTTTELINAPPRAGEVCCAGGFNQALNPERALSYEAGVRGAVAGRIRYDVALYTMGIRDEIVAFRVPEVPDRDFYRNAGKSRHVGFEMGAEAQVGAFVELAGAYTYSRFTFIDDGLTGRAYEGNRLPGVPPHQLTGVIMVHASRARLAMEAQHASTFFVDDANAASNPDYTVVDLRLEADARFSGFRLAPFLAIENVFDRRYNGSVVVNAVGGRYYEPAPGRHLLLGLTLPAGAWR